MSNTEDRQNGHKKSAGRPSTPPDHLRCTAKSRARQEHCKGYRVAGTTVCRHHGGNTPRGIASPITKDGRYSKLLPRHLADRFEALAGDPEFLNLGRDLALLDVRIEELLKRVATGESGAGWAVARETLAQLRAAMAAGDGQAVRDAYDTLGKTVNDATVGETTWRDIRDALQERRLLVESERRRLVDMHQTVTVEELMVFASSLVGIVNRHVADPALRTAIALDVRALLHTSGRRHGPQFAAVPALTRTIQRNGHTDG